MMADENLSFSKDIRPLFTDTDVDHMKRLGMDLSSRDGVADNAENILSVVTSGEMPPASENRAWTKDMCGTFERWMKQGCPP